ncbi:MAG: MBL fold metallo-hydrolase [Verrucomicrobia bacterium]|nr:MBL fold metallo-hydrolase [Verrucomicrobiota bacterium]
MKHRTTCVLEMILCLAVCACCHAAEPADTGAGKFTLTVLDIPDIHRGAGLALVMQTPGGRTFLYDTGNGYPSATNVSGWASDHNSGRDLIAPLLRQRGVKELDGVVISHAHYDHFGGFVWLVDHFPIRKLYDTGYEMPGRASGDYSGELGHYAKLRQSFMRRPGAHQVARAGDKLDWDKQLVVEVLAPPKEFFHERHPENRPKNDPPAHYLLNANAMILRIQHGKVVFVLGGDIEAEDQRISLLPSLPPGKLKCDVLIAPGHGIHAIPEFAEATRPKVAVASLFARWAKGIPAWKVYGAVGAKVYVTGVHGQVEFVSNGENFTTKAARESR